MALAPSLKRPVLLTANFVLTKDRNGLTTDIFVVKYTGRGLVVKRPAESCLGVGGLLPFSNVWRGVTAMLGSSDHT